ncbi:MAG: baseplate J/gp47 family protein, partial [Bacteroidaceae bacterium]|nr:baseplate J/gp47 family protein [Bacteroidaceae bacterium]
ITEIIVTNGTNFQIKNKFGLFLNQAGIYPFGTVAAIGDSFSIELPNNAFVKKDTTVNLSWLNDKTKKSMEDNYAGEKADGKGEGNEDSSKYIFFYPEDVDAPTGGLKVSLKTDKYNQIKYAYNYSKQISDYIIKQGSTNIEEKPIIPELEAPISLNYSINIEKLQKHTISPFGTITEKVIPNAQEIPHKQITTPQQITKTLPTISEFAYILLENVHETDVLSLYFKLNPYCNFETQNAITYYKSEAWTQLQTKDIISDSTDGLRHSGILTIRVSKSMLETKLQQGAGMLWIRVPCKDNFLEAVFTQAAELEFNPQSEGMVENGETIPAGTISKSLISIAGVKKIEQKFDGLPGNADESEIQFKSRVSERLRHKNRAVSEWDYERIVLEHFPEVEAARCLSCCDGNGKFAPGHITLLLFPYKNELNGTDQLQPKLTDKTLCDVEAYLKERMSPFVKLHVINPKYVSATVECDIKLAKGCNDTTYYEELLNEALKQYLAPWYETSEPIQIDADKNHSNVIEFLNELEYVDNVDTTTIKIIVENKEIKDGSVLQPQNPIKVLTSSLNHTINISIHEQEQ